MPIFRIMWINSESPLINKEGWTKEEDTKLFTLAKKYKAHNWELVAKELGVLISFNRFLAY